MRVFRKGFTLVEVLVAVVVLVIMAWALFAMIGQGFKTSSHIRNRNIAFAAIEAESARIETRDFTSAELSVGTHAFDILDSEGNPIPGFTGTTTVNADVDLNRLKDITITVGYHRAGKWNFTIATNTAKLKR